MKIPSVCHRLLLSVAATAAIASPARSAETVDTAGYGALVQLFQDWRTFERPPMRDGAPDYSASTFAKRLQELAAYRQRLEAIDTAGWPVEARVDQALVRAEMNGFDFYARVLQPWARDPAYYTSIWTAQSDTPAHEGSEHHGIVELWTYQFPLSREAEKARRRTRRRPAAPRPGGNQSARREISSPSPRLRPAAALLAFLSLVGSGADA